MRRLSNGALLLGSGVRRVVAVRLVQNGLCDSPDRLQRLYRDAVASPTTACSLTHACSSRYIHRGPQRAPNAVRRPMRRPLRCNRRAHRGARERLPQLNGDGVAVRNVPRHVVDADDDGRVQLVLDRDLDRHEVANVLQRKHLSMGGRTASWRKRATTSQRITEIV